MKNLIFIRGAMGVGKSTVSEELFRLLPHSAWLDGDWAWKINPFTVTEETKTLVLDNCARLLQSYLDCSAVDSVIFSWVMQSDSIIFEIKNRLILKNVDTYLFTLTGNAESVEARLLSDIAAGKREKSVLKRSRNYLPMFEEDIGDIKINTEDRTPREIAEMIFQRLNRGDRSVEKKNV